MFRMWLCLRLPWHEFVMQKQVSPFSERLTCSCGRMYAVNHSTGIMLPWHHVEGFYRMKEERRAALRSEGRSE